MDNDSSVNALARAKEIEAHVRSLMEEQDALLDPIIKDAENKSDEEIETLISEFPSGYHRTELRAILNKRREGL